MDEDGLLRTTLRAEGPPLLGLLRLRQIKKAVIDDLLGITGRGGGNRTTQINQKVRSYSDQIDTFVGTFDVFDLEDSPLINILAGRFWIVF